ncbi:uncharacterized protein LOC144886385 isoform X1 [Branchiostoma floridae x Branchiostoma japonicum]
MVICLGGSFHATLMTMTSTKALEGRYAAVSRMAEYLESTWTYLMEMRYSRVYRRTVDKRHLQRWRLPWWQLSCGTDHDNIYEDTGRSLHCKFEVDISIQE